MERRLATIISLVAILVTPAWATTIDLTASGLGLSSGNYGEYLVIDNVVQISAVTHIGQADEGPGTVYLNGDKGFGVKTFTGGGSKGISGSGGDQDEALVLDFITDVWAVSLQLGLSGYKASDDDPIISVMLSNGNEMVFTEAHANWTAAVTLLGDEKVVMDVVTLLGSNDAISSVTVTETRGHLYVNGVGCNPVPEPATVVLLGLGCLVLIRKRCK